MSWLCIKRNRLLCTYERDFGDNDIITIVSTGLITKKYVAVLSLLNLVSYFVKCNHPIDTSGKTKRARHSFLIVHFPAGGVTQSPIISPFKKALCYYDFQRIMLPE
jgi:hypothetical protein